jgi:hypothetical protein
MVATLRRVNYRALPVRSRTMNRRRYFLFVLAFITAVGSILGDQEPTPTPSPGTGIEGSVSISPIHGGPSKVGEANSGPLRNTQFVVENAAGVVVSFQTDEEGRFRVPLPPGRYTVRRATVKRIGRCGPFEVEVDAAGFKKVEFACDSGMR